MSGKKIQPELSLAGTMELTAFLASSKRPKGTLSFHEAQGFLFTIASSPDSIAPSEWLPLIFDDGDMNLKNASEAQHVMGQLMALYNQVNESVLQRSDSLPAGCSFSESVLEDIGGENTVAQWSRGFAVGQGWLEETWNSLLPEELSDECGATMMVLSFFGSQQLADALFEDASSGKSNKPPHTMEEFANTMREMFPAALASFAHIGRTIFEVRMQSEKTGPAEPVRSNKVGRNDPCTCGSGKKYKKCCGIEH